MSALLPLVQRLKTCPTQDERITAKQLIETWNCFKTLTPEHGDTVTPAVLVGVILYDPEGFGTLLPRAEREQLTQLGQLAFQRYQERSHPPQPMGTALQAAVKEVL